MDKFSIISVGATDSFDFACNGTNDSDQFTAAIVQAIAERGAKKVVVYPGDYKFDGAVEATFAAMRLVIEFLPGAVVTNISSTQSHSGGDLFYLTGDGVQGPDGAFLEIINPELVGNSTGGMGLVINDVFQGEIRNPRIRDFTSGAGWGIGLLLDGSIDFNIYNPQISGCAYSNLSIGNASNANNIFGGWLYDAAGANANCRVSSANGNTFYGTIFETAASGYGIVSSGGRSNVLIGCWIENNKWGVYVNDESLTIRDSWFTLNTTLDIDVRPAANDFLSDANHFNDGGKITYQSGTDRPSLINSRGVVGISALTDLGAVSPYALNNK